jgi:hypothetical protein
VSAALEPINRVVPRKHESTKQQTGFVLSWLIDPGTLSLDDGRRAGILILVGR